MSSERDDFRKEYDKKHALCPKCLSKKHTSTMVGFLLDLQNKENYRDLNRCECLKCGDKHYAHDRVEEPKPKEFY